jgi:hypothetical protein
VIVSDASSTGFAFYWGEPWQKPQTKSFWAGVWSQAQSLQTSNWRELKTVVLALKCTYFAKALQNAFVVFVSDNATTVAVANWGESKGVSLRTLTKEFRQEVKHRQVDTAGVHLPGKLNVFTDKASRATESWWEKRTSTPPKELLSQLSTKFSAVTWWQGRRLRVCKTDVAVWWPTPHKREEGINDAIMWKARHGVKTVLIILPQGDFIDLRWGLLKSKCKLINNWKWHQRSENALKPTASERLAKGHDVRSLNDFCENEVVVWRAWEVVSS